MLVELKYGARAHSRVGMSMKPSPGQVPRGRHEDGAVEEQPYEVEDGFDGAPPYEGDEGNL